MLKNASMYLCGLCHFFYFSQTKRKLAGIGDQPETFCLLSLSFAVRQGKGNKANACMYLCMYTSVCVGMCTHAHSCPILCYPINCSLVVSSDHGILQARILEWVAIPFFGGSSPPRGQTCVSWVSWIGRRILSHWITWEAITSSLNPFCRGKIGTHISLATSLGPFHSLLPSPGNAWPLSLACLLSFCLLQLLSFPPHLLPLLPPALPSSHNVRGAHWDRTLTLKSGRPGLDSHTGHVTLDGLFNVAQS